jgi:hypothetical protein
MLSGAYVIDGDESPASARSGVPPWVRVTWPSFSYPSGSCIAAFLPDVMPIPIYTVELARGGMTPDWLPGAVPHCVPVETKTNQRGERASTFVVGTERALSRGKWRTFVVLACPVTWRPHPEQIAAARRGYDEWLQALSWVRDVMVAGGILRDVEATSAMQKVRPWQDSTARSSKT